MDKQLGNTAAGTEEQRRGLTIPKTCFALDGDASPLVIAGHDFSAHDLRRTCMHNVYEFDAPQPLLQALLGHEDRITTGHSIGSFESDNDTAAGYLQY